MSSSKISLANQVDALEETVRQHRNWVRSVERLVDEGRRPVEVLNEVKRLLPAMEASLKTMNWLIKNEEKIKAALS